MDSRDENALLLEALEAVLPSSSPKPVPPGALPFSKGNFKESSKKEKPAHIQAQSSDSCNSSVENQSSSVLYSPLAFQDAAEFLMFFDPMLKSRKKRLYRWQIEELIRLSQKGQYTTENPFEYLLLAANGSGKDAYIIAGFACYVLCCWRRYKIVITSASDLQLDSQTRNYIKYLSENVNAYCQQQGIMDYAIDIKKESFKSSVIIQGSSGQSFSLTGSEIITFVTKEGGRAEGHHPFPDADLGEGVILIVNEAKTVPQEIYEHFAKCTYNIFIQVSSAGPARGHFYNSCVSAVEFPALQVQGKYYLRTITAYECLHISRRKLDREREEYGDNDPWFKNTRLSQFSSIGEAVVITEEVFDKAYEKKTGRIEAGLGRRAGLDLAGGGDENVLTVVEENEVIAQEAWRAKDTELTVELLVGDSNALGLFQKYDLKADKIYGDDNGLGQPIIDGLARKGYRINRILNQSQALNTQRYLNRGAELWFIFARLLQAGYIAWGKFEDVGKLKLQLCGRHYSQDPRLGKLKLWAKQEEKLKGSTSPDRADSLVLAFTGTSIFDFTESRKPSPPTTPGSILPTSEILRASEGYRKWQRRALVASSRSILTNNPIALVQSLYD